MSGQLRQMHDRQASGVNAHPLLSMAEQVSTCIAGWRKEVEEQWGGSGLLKLPAERLAEVLVRGQRLHIAPELTAFVMMASEWLFRARPFTEAEVGRQLDRLEWAVQRSLFGGNDPELASLVTAAIGAPVGRHLLSTTYWVAVGKWGTPGYDWRDAISHGAIRGEPSATLYPRSKPGAIPKLGPIMAGLLLEGIAELSIPRGAGTEATGVEIVSALRQREVQTGEFARWRTLLSTLAAPDRPVGPPDSTPPSNLREWLVLRWNSGYQTAFTDRGRDWSGYVAAVTDNPYGVYGPIVDLDVIREIYRLSWSKRGGKATRSEQQHLDGTGKTEGR